MLTCDLQCLEAMECPVFNVRLNTCVKVTLVVLFQTLPQRPYPLSLLCVVVMYSNVVRLVASSHMHSSRGFSDRLLDRTKAVRGPKRERVSTYRTAAVGILGCTCSSQTSQLPQRSQDPQDLVIKFSPQFLSSSLKWESLT